MKFVSRIGHYTKSGYDAKRFFHILFLRPHTIKDRFLNVVYFLLFSELILYSIFTTLYLDIESPSSDIYDIENVAVEPIICSFSISSQYQKTPRYICYLLLAATVIIRNYEWLAAGAAASVMTYSGIAAVHVILLFVTNNRFNPPEAKTRCEQLPFPGVDDIFLACAGVDDPDIGVAVSIVSNIMLGALPMAALSTTFRISTGRVILMFCLLLLAVSHTFQNLMWYDPNLHFQVCPKGAIEPPPGPDFQAPFLDQSWYESLNTLVSTAQQTSQPNGSTSSSPCIYSCFASTAYIGRSQRDIGVFHTIGFDGPFIKTTAENRISGIAFWWLYTLLAFLTIFTTNERRHLPKWMYKRVHSLERYQQALASRWERRHGTNIAMMDTSVAATEPRRSIITIFTLIQTIIQFVGVAVFCGAVVSQEVPGTLKWSKLEREPFAAVGQWGNLAVVLLVLLAALIKRMWSSRETNNAAVTAWRLEKGGKRSDNLNEVSAGNGSIEIIESEWECGTDDCIETRQVDWDWRIGYAS